MLLMLLCMHLHCKCQVNIEHRTLTSNRPRTAIESCSRTTCSRHTARSTAACIADSESSTGRGESGPQLHLVRADASRPRATGARAGRSQRRPQWCVARRRRELGDHASCHCPAAPSGGAPLIGTSGLRSVNWKGGRRSRSRAGWEGPGLQVTGWSSSRKTSSYSSGWQAHRTPQWQLEMHRTQDWALKCNTAC
jgi:hypothetical protein